MGLPKVRDLLDCQQVLQQLADLPLDDDDIRALRAASVIVNDCIAKWATMRG